MRLHVRRLAPSLLALLGTLLLGLTSAAAAPVLPGQASPVAGTAVPVCPGPVAAADTRCFAERRTDPQARNAVPAPAGVRAQPDVLGNNGAYDPSYLQAAYALQLASPSLGSGATVAIVDAYDDRTAASDLAAYRSYFGLPACGSGCFTKVNQKGIQGSYPRPNNGWAQEISLDLDMVSAICPNCKILLVEANSSSMTDLATAVRYAASRPDVVAISNSYGASEWSGETSYQSAYNQPGKAVVASSGDNGYGVQFPAASQFVTAVGGTSLVVDATASRGWTEGAWSGAGSGCSAYITKPTWQTDAACASRTVADVSAVADPNTGVWVYFNGGWYIFGGTSVAAPIVASVYALAGNTSALTYGSDSYAHLGSMFDVTSGSNGACGGTYLCTGTSGYDGPTGNGTPDGTGGF